MFKSNVTDENLPFSINPSERSDSKSVDMILTSVFDDTDVEPEDEIEI
jgi:hypothetical protein